MPVCRETNTDGLAVEPDARLRPSPNFGARAEGRAPTLIVLHYTGMQSAEAALERLCDPQAQVSAHYLIDLDGSLHALVAEKERAWHAGVASWRGESDVNSASIGIELVNFGHLLPEEDGVELYHPFPEPQMRRLEALVASLQQRWGIGPEGVVGHSDIAPERKRDPGKRFDWARLERRGLAIGPLAAGLSRADTSGAAPERFIRGLRRIGYGDWKFEALLDAYRARFTPSRLGASFSNADAASVEAVVQHIVGELGIDD